MLKKVTKLSVSKYHNNHVDVKPDYIAIETPLEIRLGHDRNNFETLAITMCSPDDIEDLVYGYLFTEQIIKSSTDILSTEVFDNKLGLIIEVILDKSISYDGFLNKRHGMVHASCGVCGKTEFEDLLTCKYSEIKLSTINPTIIKSLPQKLYQAQSAFKQTGGLHASALFDEKGELIYIKEDIGRHNALDKLIGCALQKELVPLDNHTILLSGRISFELVHKSLMAGATSLAAIGAPSSLSIEIANFNKLNLIGFVKDDGYNLY